MSEILDYTKLKTIIYTDYTGYYGSYYLWYDAAYAFRNRFQPIGGYTTISGVYKGNPNYDKWIYLDDSRKSLASKLLITTDALPASDYEFCEL